jgi:hypothetical protein
MAFFAFSIASSRAALRGYLGPGDGRGPLPKAALNALYNRVFDPAIAHRDAFVFIVLGDGLARPQLSTAPPSRGHGGRDGGRAEPHSDARPRKKRSVRWVVPTQIASSTTSKASSGDYPSPLHAGGGAPSSQSCSSANALQAASIRLYCCRVSSLAASSARSAQFSGFCR